VISLIDRLRHRCRVTVDECWEWTGALDGKGLPSVQIIALRRHTLPVRRLMYLLAVGPLAKGRLVLTTCENEKCVNPAHLQLTSKACLNRLICQTRRPRKKKLAESTWHPPAAPPSRINGSGVGKTSKKPPPPVSPATSAYVAGLLTASAIGTARKSPTGKDASCGPLSEQGVGE
jgi:hypothetical protein